MQASDISHLAGKLKDILVEFKKNDKLIAGCVGVEALSVVEELINCLGRIVTLVSGVHHDLQKRAGVINKEWEKGVKCELSKLQSLFLKTGKLITSTQYPYVNLNFKEAENILEKLNPYSRYETIATYDTVSLDGGQLDKDKLIELVLDPRARTLIPILFGVGAEDPFVTRLVFDDPRAQNHFNLLSWVSMSGVKRRHEVLSHVVQSLGEDQCIFSVQPWNYFDVNSEGHEEKEDYRSSSRKERYLNEQLERLVEDKKCLLVLDNVSDLLMDDLLTAGYYQDDKCPFSPAFFKATAVGSKILITSRGGSASKHLELINQNSSWALFKSISLEAEGEVQETSHVLSAVGHKICRKCDNNPTVIKIIASILSTRHTVEEWEHFHDVVLAGVGDLTRVVLQTIADPLPFCSLFPKDYEFTEDDFIAEYGFGSRFDEFLVKGYFLKDDKGGGGIPEVTYKMNYLTYDLMKHLAGYEYTLVDKCTTEVNLEIIRHVSFVVDSSWQAPSWLANAKKLKTLLFRPSKQGEVVSMPNIDLSHLIYLRTLDFGAVHCESLRYFLGDLTNLTYLRLGSASCKSVPQSITTLQRLMSLNLRQSGVTVLPAYFYELRNLICLYAGDKLTEMLPTLVFLKSLRRIDVLKVDQSNWFDAITLMKYITAVRKLIILFENAHVQGSFHKHRLSLSHVIDLSLVWSSSYGETRDLDFWILPTVLRSLTVRCWKGEKFPTSFMNNLSNIVSIQILNCSRCQRLPAFRELPHLVTLKLWGLISLEYIECMSIPSLPKLTSPDNEKDADEGNAYFRSLKYLMVGNLPKLKRWSKNEDDCRNVQRWGLPLLSELTVSGCPQLKTMPPMPILESLEAINIHGDLLQHLLCSQASPDSSSIASQLTCSKLKKLHIVSFCELGSLPTKKWAGILQHNLSFLEELQIDRHEELDWDMNLNEADGINISPSEAWQGLKMLRSLQISNISNLETLPRGLECLTILEQLSLCRLYNLKHLPDWLGNFSRLRRLVMQYCPKLIMLPNSLGSLSTLQVFEILYCPRLKKLPETFQSLKSLQKLEIRECPKLERRCQKPYGQDWPLIQHIPHVICAEFPFPGAS